MTKKQKKNLIRIILASVLMTAFLFVPVGGVWRLLLFLVPYLIVGYDILIKAAKGIIHLQPFDECFLMAVATIGAIAVGLMGDGDYVEAVAVMLFYQIGEWFQSYAVGKSRKNISKLMDIRPDHANIERGGGTEEVDPDEVETGSVIVVKPGERIPIDGVIIEGESALNTSALTGESLPKDVMTGDEVISGCVNMTGVLRIRTTKEFGDSTVSRILDLVENASSRKSKSENFISKFARYYTPIVVFSAVALALLPPLVIMLSGGSAAWSVWIYRALTFLVISCPCALVISIPLTFFAGIGGASREGVLVKGSNCLEALSKAKTMVFDKTGTLTKGVFEVVSIHPDKVDENTLLHMAAHVERFSSHPIALSLRAAYPEEADGCEITDVKECAGQGVTARVNGDIIAAGNPAMMKSVGALVEKCPHNHVGTVIHVARNGEYLGHIEISDVVKPTSAAAIASLRKAGIKKTVMLTGDSEAAAKKAAEELDIDEVYSGLLPEDKVNKVEELLSEQKGKELTAFVGDGINDAPVLTRADIGIAMGALGSDAAIEAADVVLMDDDPLKISKAMRISGRCMAIVKENIWFSIGVKVLCLVLGALGLANMWTAIFADVGVMVIAVLNAVRALFTRKV
ncbi:MAG: cadmium-translocating P-type ATPase [Clostridia bacterium]|nr:cadmium-translocating P-type ATPase [Clostridia bacterium]